MNIMVAMSFAKSRVCFAAFWFAGLVLGPALTLAGGSQQVSGKRECVTETDVQAQNTKGPRFTGRDARIFVEVVEPGADTTFFDTVVIFSGVLFAFKDGCVVGRKFLSGLNYIDATQMVSLFASNEALKQSQDLDSSKLIALAEGGNAPAQFHMGLTYGIGETPGVKRDQGAAIEWLKRSASANFSPAMIALGMALSGPDWLDLTAHIVGEPIPSDEFTDRALAYFWLDLATQSEEQSTRNYATSELASLMGRMSPNERSNGRRLILDREHKTDVVIDETATLYKGAHSGVAIFAAPDLASLHVVDEESAKFRHKPVVFTGKESDADIKRVEAELESQRHAFQARVEELESEGRVFSVYVGTVVRVVRAESEWAKVEIMSGKLKGKVVYVKSGEFVK